MSSSSNRTLLLILLLAIVSPRICADTLTTPNANNAAATAPALSLQPAAQDSGSIELPVRRQQRSDQSQHRPIVDLVLGVLDTLQSSSYSQIRRIQARHARQQDQAQYYETSTAATEPATMKAATTRTGLTMKKRFIAAKY